MNTPNSQFHADLTKIARARIKELRAEGTVAIGRGCLWQIIAAPASRLQSAPRGTNAAYFARLAFDEVCADLPDGDRKFVTM